MTERDLANCLYHQDRQHIGGADPEGRSRVIDVSVLTPALDYGRFIEDGIMSVDGQEELSIEHIVQDGGSGDETIEVLRRHTELQWESEPDRGQSDALNRALRRSTGRWIGWLNADEFYLPGGLA